MQNSQYFDHGYPLHPRQPRYGLYHPVFDCVLITAGDLAQAELLKFILSSRYATYVVCLNTAENYYYNIFDNENCDQWTVSNLSSNLIECLFNRVPGTIDHLIEQTKQHPNLIQEKEWAIFCHYYIKKILTDDNSLPNYTRSDNLLNSLLDLPLAYRAPQELATEKNRRILKILYLERDIRRAEEQIKSLVQFDV